jgi:hypothetical protein
MYDLSMTFLDDCSRLAKEIAPPKEQGGRSNIWRIYGGIALCLHALRNQEQEDTKT